MKLKCQRPDLNPYFSALNWTHSNEKKNDHTGQFVLIFIILFTATSIKGCWLTGFSCISLALTFHYSHVQPTHFHLSLLLSPVIQLLSPPLMCGNKIDPQPGRRRPVLRLYCFLLMMRFMADGTSSFDVNKDPGQARLSWGFVLYISHMFYSVGGWERFRIN